MTSLAFHCSPAEMMRPAATRTHKHTLDKCARRVDIHHSAAKRERRCRSDASGFRRLCFLFINNELRSSPQYAPRYICHFSDIFYFFFLHIIRLLLSPCSGSARRHQNLTRIWKCQHDACQSVSKRQRGGKKKKKEKENSCFLAFFFFSSSL